MPLTQVSPGDRILSTDINQYFNILKGVAASGEAITLIYNAVGSVILQPSSDPSAGTEAIQIKNNGGTVQGSLTFDGKFKAADGTAPLPGLRFQSEATGLYRSGAGLLDVALAGVQAAEFGAAAVLFKDGSQALPGVSFLSDTDTGIWRAGPNDMIAGTGGHINTEFFDTASAVNWVVLTNAAAGAGVAVGSAGSDTDIDLRLTPKGAGVVDTRYSATAMGGGAAPTLGTIGGSGPATAGQNAWLKVKVNGTASYIPFWR